MRRFAAAGVPDLRPSCPAQRAPASSRTACYASTTKLTEKEAPYVCHDRKLSGRRGDPAIHDPGRWEAELEALRARIEATRWPDEETVADHSQGPQLATMQALARYWATEYDWRRCETKLNALPHFMTEIDGLDIHFIHVRSNHDNALPIIITHGWPGSVIELLAIIDPLTNPTALGAGAADAFDVVIPSMPGYGYSGKPRETGWGPDRIARAWAELMKRLGYTRFVAQGGDWGAIITDVMAAQAPRNCSACTPTWPAWSRRCLHGARA